MRAQSNEYKLTVADIQRCFWVDDTGTVRWKQSVEPVAKHLQGKFKGTVAGRLTVPRTNGLAYRQPTFTIHGDVYHMLAQDIAYVLHHGAYAIHSVEHGNGNGLDNSKANLRDVPLQINRFNTGVRKRSRGIRGILVLHKEGAASTATVLYHSGWAAMCVGCEVTGCRARGELEGTGR